MNNLRKDFSKIKKIIDVPNLIEVQKKSYERFLQAHVEPDKRENVGLQAAFKSVFPIKDFNEQAFLEFVSYSLGKPRYSVEECIQRGVTYSVPMKICVRLVIWDKDEESGSQSIRDVKEQEVYFGEIPLMTDKGTFNINGTERVIVSQLHRSPGVFFSHDKKSQTIERPLFSARIIPHRGSWLDFEFDSKDILYVRIDKRRKLPATILLKALGYTMEELLNYFYDSQKITIAGDEIHKEVESELLLGQRVTQDIKDPETEEVIVRKGRKITKASLRKIKALDLKSIPIYKEDIIGGVFSNDLVDPATGEVIAECNTELTEEKFEQIKNRGIKEFRLIFIDNINVSAALRNTLAAEKISSQEEALIEIYKKLRPGDPPNLEIAKNFLENLFFNPDKYDLSKVGRLKLNHKLGMNVPLECRTLRKEDILKVVKYLLDLKSGKGTIDDIDHLGNRRVRTVGELVEGQFRVGLVRMERAIKERMSLQEIDTLMPYDLINPKPVMAVLKEFFGSGQLSQFMDQTNPLSEVTHRRRLSALGPGGLTRERAGFEVRDVHPSHYGRICPIETPEGPNIGLIVSLSSYAGVNEFGFIETPYREVVDGKVTDRIRFLSAFEEEEMTIAQANAPVDENGYFTADLVSCRRGGEFVMVPPQEVSLMDVSPKQLVSIAASLIPFLEHDDANRALMGSNMQRQAVPLLRAEAPIIATGMEEIVARDAGVTVIAKRDGVVAKVDASRIIVKCEEEDGDVGIDVYKLTKFKKSNQNTCINQKPLVKEGERVRRGQIIADGPATHNGELALGRNVLVAFMPWSGYNFEDSILVSEKLVKDDSYTSIHIEEFEVVARDTKLGKEEITKDIPNVSEEVLRNLDENGIVRIGAEVEPGDILVGKITPKGEVQLSPEEKLLRAIFGDKAGEVRDTSFRVPPGVYGTVIDAKVFSRKGVKGDKDKELEERGIARLLKDKEDQLRIVKDRFREKISRYFIGRKTKEALVAPYGRKILLEKNKIITQEDLDRVPFDRWKNIKVDLGEEGEVAKEISKLYEKLEEQIDIINAVYDEEVEKLKRADELPPGVIKMIKVYVASKRKLSVGDKMAGRHGNKGVVSKIVPEEDMPYLADGTPVEIVLNPLGVPSRMNVGQILETHLGWASKELGSQINRLIEEHYSPEAIKNKLLEIYSPTDEVSKILRDASDETILNIARRLKNGIPMCTPVFEGATEQEILEMMKKANLPVTGQTTLYDGRTGEPFDQKVTVGLMYMLKLHHLVDDKIHARSIGPYSLVTQQPLGGKAQFGGQRVGEMEVWALEAYGAAHSLQEFLTVKSDDLMGRARIYESIVRGEKVLDTGIPESFNVLVKELQGLALNVELMEKGEENHQ